MTDPVSTAAAATLAPASASAPLAGWASSASTAGAASGEWGVVLEGRAQREAEAMGRARWFQAGGRCRTKSGEDRAAPRGWRTICSRGDHCLWPRVLLYRKMNRFEARVEAPQRGLGAAGTGEESSGSQRVSKPVPETGPLSDKRGIQEKMRELVLLKHLLLTSPCSLGLDELPNSLEI